MATHKRAAAVVLLRPGNHQPIEILLARRDQRLAFLGGFHAFVGGAMDPVDEQVATTIDSSGERLAIAVDAAHRPVPEWMADGAPVAAFMSTACRELFEETGVLVARGADRLTSDERRALRHQLLADSSVWAQLLARHTLTLEPLIFLGHWVTPPYSPVVFHANYFAAWLPDGQQEELWPGELSDVIWLSPREALCGHQDGELFISYPVLETLRLLERHGGDLEAASAEAQTRGKLSPLGGELILGVHVVPLRTFTLPPATHTNCYVLGGHKEVVIVDPGSPIEAEQAKLEAFLDRLDVRVREIWLTHHHPDHVGGVARLRARTGAPVVAHAHTAEALAAEGIVERIVPDGEVSLLDLGGGAVAEWVALHTPGHARGHLCFYERTRALLLTGDNVVTLSTVIIAPPDGDMSIYMSSLARLRDLNARFLFPGHGPPSATPRAKIEEYIEHRQKREQAILEALDQPRTTSDIVRQVYSDIDQSLWSLAEVNVGAHLDKLAREGRVISHGKTWVLAAS